MHSWDRIPSSSRTCHLAGRVYSTPHKWANDRQMMADVLYFYFWWVGDVFVWYTFLEENDVRAVFSHRWDLGHKVRLSCPQNSLKKTCEVGGHRISPTPTLYVVNLDFAHLCSWTAPDFWAFLIQARTAVTSMTMPPRQWHSFDKLVGTPGNLQKHRWTMFMLQRFARSFALFMLMFKRMHDHIRWPMMFSRNPKVHDMFIFFQCLFSLEHLETPESDELRS